MTTVPVRLNPDRPPVSLVAIVVAAPSYHLCWALATTKSFDLWPFGCEAVESTLVKYRELILRSGLVPHWTG